MAGERAMPRVIDCDVAVVGGGPAGIAAATRAAESGASTVVVDLGARGGGQVWRHLDQRHLPRLARRWLERCERSGARWLRRAMVIDAVALGQGGQGAAEGEATPELIVSQRQEGGEERSFVLRARAVVLATGARELFLPYPGWTLPNAMGIGGAQALLRGGADVRGRRVVIAGSGPLILPVAAAMARAGASIVTVAEQAPRARVARFAGALWAHPSKLAQAIRYRAAFARTAYRTGVWVTRADGRDRVERVTLTDGRRQWTEACDVLCCSYGLVPTTELAQIIGCEVAGGRVTVDELQRTTVARVFCAGEPTGIGGELAALVEGEIAGLAAAGRESAASEARLQRARNAWRRFTDRIAETFCPREELRALADDATIVCRCEDVRRGRLDAAWSVRQAKLYSRIGMGPCQGAVCGPACQFLFGWAAGSVRPPLGAPPVGVWAEGGCAPP